MTTYQTGQTNPCKGKALFHPGKSLITTEFYTTISPRSARQASINTNHSLQLLKYPAELNGWFSSCKVGFSHMPVADPLHEQRDQMVGRLRHWYLNAKLEEVGAD
eukprot:3594203-Amphidinium_carterae.1